MKRKVVLFDLPKDRIALQPFTFVRPFSTMRVGIATIEEKWKHYFPGSYAYVTCSSLHDKYPTVFSPDAWYINGTICPDVVVAESIERLNFNEILLSERGELIACRLDEINLKKCLLEEVVEIDATRIPFAGEITQIRSKRDIFTLNAREIEKDWAWYTQCKANNPISDSHTIIYNKENIFIEEGLSIKSALLNAEAGSIYIGPNVTIEEGVVLRGPLAICEGARVQVHSYLYEGTTIGPFSTVSGEICNSVIFGYSNKKPQGFMGHSVIGEWCEIGSGINLINNKYYPENISVWDSAKENIGERTDFHLCGFFMGDYSYLGSNVTLETGSVIGIAANLPPGKICGKYVPSFMYADPDKCMKSFPLEHTMKRLESMMQSKNMNLSKESKNILYNIFKKTSFHRIKAMIPHAICHNS